MKKVLCGFLVAVSFSFSGLFNSNGVLSTSSHKILSADSEKHSIGDWTEYICADGQWYRVTHYTDGSIGIVQVAHPNED